MPTCSIRHCRIRSLLLVPLRWKTTATSPIVVWICAASLPISLGKGLQLDGEGNSILNVDLGYMDSKIDPTDNFENYKRVTGALRYTLRGDRKEKIKWQWNSAFDYSGSFDDSKSDPDINYGRVDEYKSSYSRLALTNGFNVKMPKSWFKELDVNTLVSLQLDRLRQTRLVAPQRYGIVPLSWSDGENEAQAVYAEYTAHYLCDGKPFNAYVKAKGVMGFKTPYTLHTIKVGANWDSLTSISHSV